MDTHTCKECIHHVPRDKWTVECKVYKCITFIRKKCGMFEKESAK